MLYKNWEKQLIKLSNKSFLKNDVPISAIVVDDKNKIIGKGYNLRKKKHNILGHAEIIALQQANKKRKCWKLFDCTIITTHEPCMMCLGAIYQSKIKNLIYLNDEPKYGFVNSNHTFDISKINIKKIKSEYNFNKLIKSFFEKIRKEKNNILT